MEVSLSDKNRFLIYYSFPTVPTSSSKFFKMTLKNPVIYDINFIYVKDIMREHYMNKRLCEIL